MSSPKPTFTDWGRRTFKGVFDTLGAALLRLGLTPNAMTLLGLLISVAGAALLALGQIQWGGALVLLAGPFDALDGTMARLNNQPTKLGAFADSVVDRWSELAVFFGLLYYYFQQGDLLLSMLVFAATMGSVMVSYTKSRAETLGFTCNVGIFTRVERYLVLAPALVLGIPWLGVGLIAVLGNFTAVQRAWHVWQQAKTVR